MGVVRANKCMQTHASTVLVWLLPGVVPHTHSRLCLLEERSARASQVSIAVCCLHPPWPSARLDHCAPALTGCLDRLCGCLWCAARSQLRHHLAQPAHTRGQQDALTTLSEHASSFQGARVAAQHHAPHAWCMGGPKLFTVYLFIARHERCPNFYARVAGLAIVLCHSGCCFA